MRRRKVKAHNFYKPEFAILYIPLGLIYNLIYFITLLITLQISQ